MSNPRPSRDGNLVELVLQYQTDLRDAAFKAMEKAYCPYSHFRVGAALLVLPQKTSEPIIFTGANVENASYPVGTCAERVAMGTAVAAGYTTSFCALAVATDTDAPGAPCGMCRQFLNEFCPKSMLVRLYGRGSHPNNLAASGGQGVAERCYTMEQLLPMSFGPDDLRNMAGQVAKPTE